MGFIDPAIVNRNKDIQSYEKIPPLIFPARLARKVPLLYPAGSQVPASAQYADQNWRTLALFSLVVLATSGWTGCELIDTSTAIDSTLQPHELPRTGQSPLPVVANTEVLLTIRSSNPADDVRLKPGQTPQPEVDTIALTQLLTQLTVTLDYPHIAVFAALDSTGSQWEYGYTNLTFHQDVLAQAGGKSRPFLYTRVNEDGFMVVVTAMLPDTPSARLNFRRYLNVHTPQEVQSGQHRLKRSHPSTGVQTTCGSEGWFDCAILTVMTDGTVVIECWPRICVEAQRLDNDWEGGRRIHRWFRRWSHGRSTLCERPAGLSAGRRFEYSQSTRLLRST